MGAQTQAAVDYTQPYVTEGLWRFNFNLGNNITMPFFAEFSDADNSFTIINATERIVCKPVIFRNDSVFFSTPVFLNEFRLKKSGYSTLTGNWHSYSKSADYKIEVTATRTYTEKPSTAYTAILTNQKWEAYFGSDRTKAIGLFNYFNYNQANPGQSEPLTGTFATETGDFRYLEGKLTDNKLELSCFDGSHVFLFTGTLNKDRDSINGMFYSGNHYSESWVATRNDKFELLNPDSITRLKPGYKNISFNFPDLQGNRVKFPSAEFDNKVTIFEIMGSWCPNCMDATTYLQSLHKKYKDKGLKVVALCFERSPDFNKSVAAISKMQNNLGAEYAFLIAGESNKDKALEALPMLEYIHSYPTTIYIDKKGEIRKIYTGYYGPSTGVYHTHYVEQTENFIEKLLME